MKFDSKEKFTYWFKIEINKYVDDSKGWASPNEYEFGAKKMLRKLSSNIVIPEPYGNGGWKSLNKYGEQIWEANYAILKEVDINSSENNIEALRHNFDTSLKKIEKFSQEVPSIPLFERFKQDFWLLFDYNVTGKEMNKYSEKLQGIFREQNSVIIKIIEEFRQIYNTFDYLDREYLIGIVQTANAAKIASEGAKLASDQAKKAAERAEKNEENLKKDVDNLKVLVQKVKIIKDDVSKLKEQENVQASKLGTLEGNIASVNALKDRVTVLEKSDSKINNQNKAFENRLAKLENTSVCKSQVDSIEKKISSLEQQVTKNSSCNEPSPKLSEESNEREASLDRKIIWAYIMGGVSLIISILSFFLG
ncbi:MAG: hypothetical protein K2K79_00650 [Paramuribaculum sp.]|nr:hypothetical protein [Paramuribaculum sp.]